MVFQTLVFNEQLQPCPLREDCFTLSTCMFDLPNLTSTHFFIGFSNCVFECVSLCVIVHLYLLIPFFLFCVCGNFQAS